MVDTSLSLHPGAFLHGQADQSLGNALWSLFCYLPLYSGKLGRGRAGHIDGRDFREN